MIHVSSTEHRLLKLLPDAKSDQSPERYGVDVMWYSKRLEGKVGIQRKEFGDLLASLDDGRLAYELGQMSQLALAVLVIEGDGRWTDDGVLVRTWGRTFTKAQIRAIECGIQNRGVWVVRTDSLLDTAGFIEMFVDWCEKEGHGSLLVRPGARGEWGQATNREFQRHLLMGLPGVGLELANRIIDKFGGIPWGWTIEKEELMEVKGLGKGKIEKIWEALEWQIGEDGKD